MTELQLRQSVADKIASWRGQNESTGSFKHIVDTYNAQSVLPVGYKMSYTDSWCAATVSAVAIELGLTKIIPTECSCERQIKLFQALGSWQENDAYVPAIGDVIYYDWSDDGKSDCTGWADHVGIVTGVSGNTLSITEGNMANMVGVRVVTVGQKSIRGYGTPNYASMATVVPTVTPTPAEPEEKSILDGVSSWAVDAWQKAYDKGIMDGSRPTATMTREELATVLNRLGLLG